MKINHFRVKILLALTLIVAVLSGLILSIITYFVHQEVFRATESDAQKARVVFRSQQAHRFSQLEELCSRFISSRALMAALGQADRSSLLNAAQQELSTNNLGDTFVAITDPNGKTLVRTTGEQFTTQLPEGKLPEELFVARATRHGLARLRGYFVRSNRIYEAICMSIGSGDDARGLVVVASELTDEEAKQLAGVLGYKEPPDSMTEKSRQDSEKADKAQDMEVSFLVEDQIVASTLPVDVRKRVERLLNSRGGKEKFEFELDGIPEVAFVTPLTFGGTDAFQVIQIAQSSLNELLSTLQQGVVFCACVGLTLCILISSRLAGGVSRPVADLVNVTREICKGNLAIRVKPQTSEEFGRLGEAMNAMIANLQLKQKHRGILGKVASPELTGEILNGHHELCGELRSVTVLSCNIQGFTSMSEKMKPRDVVALLNEHMTAMTEIVHKHGGIVDKYMGDKLMAVFGAPGSRREDARAALRAALEMRQRRRQMNEYELPSRHVQIGVGVYTGEVVAGNVGSEKQLDYTILGRTVGVALCLCGVAQSMQILAGESTVASAGEGVVATRLQPIQCRELAQPLNVFDLGNVK